VEKSQQLDGYFFDPLLLLSTVNHWAAAAAASCCFRPLGDDRRHACARRSAAPRPSKVEGEDHAELFRAAAQLFHRAIMGKSVKQDNGP